MITNYVNVCEYVLDFNYCNRTNTYMYLAKNSIPQHKEMTNSESNSLEKRSALLQASWGFPF